MPLTISNKKKKSSFFSFHYNEFSKLKLNLGRCFIGFLIFKKVAFCIYIENTQVGGNANFEYFFYAAEMLLGRFGKVGLDFLGGKDGFGEDSGESGWTWAPMIYCKSGGWNLSKGQL